MIAAYLRERFRLVMFLPLAIAIAAAAGSFGFVRLGLGVSFALLLLLQFRLWDDLADRRADTAAHPDRVLVRAASLRPFIVVVAALAILNTGLALLRDTSGLSLAALVVLHAVLGLWYRRRSGRSIAGDQLLLAKYPAFVVVVAGQRTFTDPLTIGVTAAALYAAMSLYEAWHDPSSPVGLLRGGRS